VVAVEAAVRLDRRAIRERAASRFGVDRMVDEYLQVYRSIAASNSSTLAHATPMRASPMP
jgi:hypothetical protein